MDQDIKKKLIIGASLGVAIIAGIFIKNKIEESRFKPVSRQVVIQIMKKSKKQNFIILKQVAAMSTNIATQMKLPQIDPKMVKDYLQAPQSPLKIQQSFVKNYTQFCQANKVTYSQFNDSVEFYIKNGDAQIQNLAEQFERDYETSLSGKLPQVKVIVPQSLTKQRLIEIHKKLSLKRYLLQIDTFRKVRGKTQQDLMTDPQLVKKISNPELEQQKILQEQGLGENDQPAAAVYTTAVARLRNDAGFRQQLVKIQNHYAKIFGKYQLKIRQNKITDDELDGLEDELIYSQA